MSDVVYRPANWKDLDGLVDLDARMWDEATRAGRDKWESRLRIFPEGVRVAEYDGRIVGNVCVHVIDYPSDRYLSWEEANDDGYIRNHTEKGNMVHGVNITADFNGGGAAKALLKDAIDNVSRPRGLPQMGGYRVPSVLDYMESRGLSKITSEEVLGLVQKDPIVNNLFFPLGFKLLAVKENYFAPDVLSGGWGALLQVD